MLLYGSFIVLCLATCLYAAWRGGWEGRWAATLFMIAAFGGPFIIALPFLTKKSGLLLSDGLLLAGLIVIAMRSNRYWPLWVVALHLLSVCAELAAVIDGRRISHGYEALQAFWSLPILLIMASGVLLDRRADQRGWRASSDDRRLHGHRPGR